MEKTPLFVVSLLPPSALAHSRLRKVAERCGVECVEFPPPAGRSIEVALVDATNDEGARALDALLSSTLAEQLAVVAVAKNPYSLRQLAGLSDVVDDDAIEHELLFRLEHALARHRAEIAARRSEKELRLLLELTADFAAATEVEVMLHDMTRRLAQELRIDRATLIVIEERQNKGLIVAASDDANLKNLRVDLSQYPEIRECLRSLEPVVVTDAQSHPLLEGVKKIVVAQGLQNIAALPLVLHGRVLGVLLVRRKGANSSFRPNEIEFLSTVTHATAVALRNARNTDVLRFATEKEKSARIEAEKKAEGLRRFEAYFQNLSDGIAVLDDRFRVLSMNPAGIKLLDLDSTPYSNAMFANLIPFDDTTALKNALDAARAGNVKHLVEVRGTTSKNRRAIYSMSVAPLSEEGALAIVTMRDITQSRLIADELRKTKDFLERLINSSVDAIIAADLKGKIILFNSAAERILGYSANEVLRGMNVKQLYAAKDAQDVMRKLRRQEFGGKGRLNSLKQHIISKTNERIPVNMTASILYDDAKREIASVGIFTDLRPQLKLEKELSETQEKLEESERQAMLVALAGTAAHELNQPLTSVVGYAELLRRKVTDNDAVRYADSIAKEAERMADIVRQIGRITKYETTEYVRDSRIIDLGKAAVHDE